MLASIDVGSNTVRMLLGRVEQGQLIPERYERAITRLAGDFIPGHGLAPESMQRTLEALQGFADIIRAHQPAAVRAVGTAALRRAENRTEFIGMVERQTGLQLEVIEGQQEARLSALGVLEALDPQPEITLVIDIGGGSTELILLEGAQLRFRDSYPLGVVRLCEEASGRDARRAVIEEVLSLFVTAIKAAQQLELLQLPGCEFVGTAGTVTTLAAIDQRMVNYDWRKINNHLLSQISLAEQYALLGPLEVAQREQIPGLEAGRGDLIIPGIEILQALLTKFCQPQIRVSDFGILEGLLLDISSSSSD